MMWKNKTNSWKYQLAAAVVVVWLFNLGGCASTSGTLDRNFVRPDAEEWVLGKARYSEIVAKYGPPSDEHMLRGQTPPLKHVSYTYLRGEEPAVAPGIIPVRSIAFYFHNDVLVAESFYSTFRSDHTNFDESKRSQIVKGKTRVSEVVALLGRPASKSIDPLARSREKQATIGYQFTTVTDSILPTTTTKQLVVVIGDDQMVTDFSFEMSSR